MSDYFSLLSQPASFEIDLERLEQYYFSLQRQFHPDRFVRKSDIERQTAIRKSMEINDAYQTLKFPLKRAYYLLQMQGLQVGGEQDTEVDKATLIEVLELRERMEDAKQNPQQIQRIQSEVASLVQACLNELSGAFRVQKWGEAKRIAVKLSYLEKLLDDIKTPRMSA